MGPPNVVFAGTIQPFDKTVFVPPPHSFAVATTDVDQWTPELRKFSDRCGVIYRPACLSLHLSNHALNIFRGARLDHEDNYRKYIRTNCMAVRSGWLQQ